MLSVRLSPSTRERLRALWLLILGFDGVAGRLRLGDPYLHLARPGVIARPRAGDGETLSTPAVRLYRSRSVASSPAFTETSRHRVPWFLRNRRNPKDSRICD